MDDNLIKAVAAGNVMLFLGAGFSKGSSSITGKNLPLASALANEVASLRSFDAEGDLSYATERYLSEANNKAELIELLKDTFTVKRVQPYHKFIASVPWRRVYTTNYDNVFEEAASESDIRYDIADSNDDLSQYQGRKNVCIHINGSVLKLNEDILDTSFKLTSRSYLNDDGFRTSKWYRQFKQDLENSSAILFIGYSLYDFEIKRLLHENAVYKDKVYFVNGESLGGREKFTLEQFGKVITKNVSGFSDLLKENIQGKLSEIKNLEETPLLSLSKYSFCYDEHDVRDAEVEDFLLRGALESSVIDFVIREKKGAPILIERSQMKEAIAALIENKSVIITSEFGNGKTTFLRMLASKLALQNFNIFISDNANPKQLDELEGLVRQGVKGVLFIDSYDQNIPLLRKYIDLKSKSINLVLSARTHIHDRYCQQEEALSKIGSLLEFDIDKLDIDEVNSFLNILDNTTFWSDKAGAKKYKKLESITEKNKSEIASNLLDVLSSPQIIDRVNNLIGDVFAKAEYRDTAFAIALLAVNDFPLTLKNISEVAMSDFIFQSDFKQNRNIQQLFSYQDRDVVVRSSAFALSLITNHFPHEYVIEQLLKIISKLESNDDYLKELQKSLFRFSVIERMLQKNKRKSLVYYYEKLKQEASWLKSNPHYWLQYGMAHLSLDDLDKSQACFDQSYSYAERRDNYHTNQIDTQQARLYLKKSCASFKDSFEFFKKANTLLRNVPNDSYRYKQVSEYSSVYNKCFNQFSKGNRVEFEHACKYMLTEAEKALSDLNITQKSFIQHAKSELEKIIINFSTSRSS